MILPFYKKKFRVSDFIFVDFSLNLTSNNFFPTKPIPWRFSLFPK